MIVLLPPTFILFGFSIFWLWAYLTLLQDVFQSFDWAYLTLLQDVFSIFWLWAYLTLLKDVFQSFDFERTWRYSMMVFNLLTLIVPDITPGCVSIFWLWAYLMLLQDVFNLLTLSVPDVTPGCFSIFWLSGYLTLLQDVFPEEHPTFVLWYCYLPNKCSSVYII